MKKIFVFVVILLMAASVANATDWSKTTNLSNVVVDANASFSGGIWTYTYTLTNTLGGIVIDGRPYNVHSFSVGNPDSLYWENATTTDSKFMLPTYDDDSTSIIWYTGGANSTSNTVTFSYQSEYAPTFVTLSVQDGGGAISGKNIGLSPAVPEPMSMILGAMGLAAVGGFKRFKK